MSINNLSQLEEVLQKLLIPDSKVIKEAEAILKNFTSNKACLLGFFSLLQKQKEVSVGVRHMSSILMRHKISSLWKKQDQTTQENIKRGLLEIVIQEPQ